ncbi:YcxB family protein [Pontibacter virosus]|nr:YcxB family protein [Pontibacter virosus]
MEPIRVNNSFEESYRQVLFIDNFLVKAVNKKNAKRALFCLGLSVITLLLFFTTNNESIVPWLFLMPFFWLAFVVYLLYIRYKTYKRQKYILREFVEEVFQQSQHVTITFDNDEIRAIQPESTLIHKWSDFRAYLEEDNAIYLFQKNPYLAWSFSSREVGNTTITKLKTIAKEKLPVLQDGL